MNQLPPYSSACVVGSFVNLLLRVFFSMYGAHLEPGCFSYQLATVAQHGLRPVVEETKRKPAGGTWVKLTSVAELVVVFLFQHSSRNWHAFYSHQIVGLNLAAHHVHCDQPDSAKF